MSKISAIKTEKETEEPYYKYCYGKWIKSGTIEKENEFKRSI